MDDLPSYINKRLERLWSKFMNSADPKVRASCKQAIRRWEKIKADLAAKLGEQK